MTTVPFSTAALPVTIRAFWGAKNGGGAGVWLGMYCASADSRTARSDSEVRSRPGITPPLAHGCDD